MGYADTAIPTLFFVISVCLIWSQTQKIDTYLPTHAKVRAAHIDKRVNRSSEGQTSVTYAPIVEYKYQVDNRWHVSKTVLPAATCLPAMIGPSPSRGTPLSAKDDGLLRPKRSNKIISTAPTTVLPIPDNTVSDAVLSYSCVGHGLLRPRSSKDQAAASVIRWHLRIDLAEKPTRLSSL